MVVVEAWGEVAFGWGGEATCAMAVVVAWT